MKLDRMSFFFLLVTILFVGCASPGLNQKDYLNRLEKVKLGMSKPEFQQIFPESIPRDAKQYPKGTVEVLEVVYEYYSLFPTGNRNRNESTGMEGRPQWFYFYKGRLLQYGNPGDWPTDPDLLIEKRIR